MIDERSAALREAVREAPDLGVAVPSCPGWTLLDLVHHVGRGQRRQAAIVAAGPGLTDPPERDAASGVAEAAAGRAALLEWAAESTGVLLDALREAGPERGCWAWWVGSNSPLTVGGVARHQVQEAAVHAYDAQLSVGAPQALPLDVAVDGVDEFLSTCNAGPDAWPFKPAVIEYQVPEVGAWHVSLSATGTRVTRLTEAETGQGSADVVGRGVPSDFVLVFYGRLPLETLQVEGDFTVLEQIRDWDPSA